MISLVRIHILLSLAGNLGKEAYFGKLTELLRQAAGWGMKTLLGLALGFHLIQGMILPYVDALKNGFGPETDEPDSRASARGRRR